MRLRPYQRDCVEACLAAIRSGTTRLGVSAPTGSGKTAIFTSLIQRMPARIHSAPHLASALQQVSTSTPHLANKSLVLVPTIEIAKQTHEAISTILPHLSVHLEQGVNRTDGSADITVASYQTLARNDCQRLYATFDPRDYKAVIVDEAHHSAAKSYRDILKLFDPRIGDPQIDSTTADDLAPATILAPSHPSSLEPPPDPPTLPIAAREDGAVPIIGFTATFDRADGLALGSVYEKLVYHARWVDMIGNWLSDLTFHSASIEALDLDSVQTSSGDFSTTSLAGVMSAASVIGPVVQAWTELASERRSTVVFAVDLRHMELLAAAFVAAGVADARSISSKTPVAERNRLLADFRRGAFRVLVNVGVLTEGVDIPSIDCILLARPTRSRNLLLQMIGRGLRRSEGKEDCLIIDLVGASRNGCISTPNLLGLDPDRLMNGESARQLRNEPLTTSAAPNDPVLADHFQLRKISYTELSIDDLSTPTLSTSPISSPLSWVNCGDDIFILSGQNRNYARIEPAPVTSTDQSYTSTLMLSLGTSSTPSRFHRAIPITSDSNLQRLFRSTDTFVEHNAAFAGIDCRRNAKWRARSISSAQANFIIRKIAIRSTKESDTLASLAKDSIPSDPDADEEVRMLPGEWVGRTGSVEIRSLTSGEAADAISRWMHGFGKRLKSAHAETKRARKRSKKFSAIR